MAIFNPTVTSFSGFIGGTTSTVSVTLPDTPADFSTANSMFMEFGVAWTSSVVDDDMGLGIRVMSGATVLAALDSGGTHEVLEPVWVNTASGTTNAVSFTYVNPTATKAQWDAATVDVQQTYTASMKNDTGEVISIGSMSFEIDYDVADVVAPILTLPTGTTTSVITADGSVTTNEANGTLYYFASTLAVVPGGDIISFGNNQAVSATGVQNVASGVLLTSTTYYFHYVHTDAAGNNSNVAVSAGFTTNPLDVTAPILSFVINQGVGSTTLDMDVDTDEDNGTIYGYINTSATPPTLANHESGSGADAFASQVVSVASTQTFSLGGLTPETSYYAHFLHIDDANNSSNQISSAQFTTGIAPEILNPDAFVDARGLTVQQQLDAIADLAVDDTSTPFEPQYGGPFIDTYILSFPTPTGSLDQTANVQYIVANWNSIAHFGDADATVALSLFEDDTLVRVLLPNTEVIAGGPATSFPFSMSEFEDTAGSNVEVAVTLEIRSDGGGDTDSVLDYLEWTAKKDPTPPQTIVVGGVATETSTAQIVTPILAGGTKTIGAAGDYATIDLWAAYVKALGTLTENQVGQLIDNAVYARGTETTVNFSTVTLSGFTITLDVEASVRHDGNFGTGARIEYAGAGDKVWDANNCIIKNLSIYNSSTEDWTAGVYLGQATLYGSIVKINTTLANSRAIYVQWLGETEAVYVEGGNWGIQLASTDQKVTNCMVTGATLGITGVSDVNTVVTNNVVYNCTTDFSGVFDGTVSNNASEDATHPGTSGVTISGSPFVADGHTPSAAGQLDGAGVYDATVLTDAAGDSYVNPPAIGAYATSTATGTVAVGTASETSTGLATTVAGTLTTTVGLSTEASTGLAVTISQTTTVAVGLSTSSSIAQTATSALGNVNVLAGITTSTSTGQPVQIALTGQFAVGQAASTSTGIAVTISQATAVPVGLSIEADVAQAITVAAGVINITAGLASEIDSALTTSIATGNTNIAAGLSTSTTTAQSIQVLTGNSTAVGLSTSTDIALSTTVVPGTLSTTVGLPVSTSTAQTISVSQATAVVVGLASGTDTGLSTTAVAGTRTVLTGIAAEADSALAVQPLTGGSIAVGLAASTSTGLVTTAVTGELTTVVGIPSETDTGLALTMALTTSVATGVASEIDTGLITTAITGELSTLVGLATGTSFAQPVQILGVGATAVGLASETYTALSITADVPQAITAGIALETDTANAVTISQSATVLVGVVTETDTALAVQVLGADTTAVSLASSTSTALAVTPVTGIISGTISPTSTDAEVRAGGRTIVLTLVGATWVDGVDFDNQRQAILNELSEVI